MKKRRNVVALHSNDKNIEINEQWNRDFWNGICEQEKFKATVELIENAWLMRGNKIDDLRLKRDIGLFKPA